MAEIDLGQSNTCKCLKVLFWVIASDKACFNPQIKRVSNFLKHFVPPLRDSDINIKAAPCEQFPCGLIEEERPLQKLYGWIRSISDLNVHLYCVNQVLVSGALLKELYGIIGIYAVRGSRISCPEVVCNFFCTRIQRICLGCRDDFKEIRRFWWDKLAFICARVLYKYNLKFSSCSEQL